MKTQSRKFEISPWGDLIFFMVAHEVLPVNKVFLAVVFKSGTCESGLYMSCCVTQQVLEGSESCTQSALWAAGAQQSNQEPAYSDQQPSKTCQMMVKVSFSKG